MYQLLIRFWSWFTQLIIEAPIFNSFFFTFIINKTYYIIAGIICQDDASKKICDDKSSGEMFRLKAGKENCRDVVQCTAAVSLHFKIIYIGC